MKDTSPGRFRHHRWPSSGRRFCLPPSGMCWILQSALPLRGFWFRETIYSLLWKGSNLTFRLHLVCPSLPFVGLVVIFFICRNSFLRAIYLYKYCNRTAGSRTSDHCIHCCIFYSESHYSDYQHRSIHHHQCLSLIMFFLLHRPAFQSISFRCSWSEPVLRQYLPLQDTLLLIGFCKEKWIWFKRRDWSTSARMPLNPFTDLFSI